MLQIFEGKKLSSLGGRQPIDSARAKRAPEDRSVRRLRSSAPRTVRLTREAVRIVDELRARFQQKFGRLPAPGDPMFFAAETDPIDPIDQPSFDAALISAMTAVGVDSGIIHAYRQTGRLLTEQNVGQWSRKDRDRWQAMVETYEGPEDSEDVRL